MQPNAALVSAALAIVALGCGTYEPTAKTELPPIVKRSPMEGAEDAVFTVFPPEVPHLRIEVFRAGSELSHRTFQWPSDDGFATLQRCAHKDSYERVAAGRVIFGEVRPNHFVEGRIEMGNPGSMKFQRHFNANWGPRSTGCG